MGNLRTDLLHMRELVGKRDELYHVEGRLQQSMPEFHKEYDMRKLGPPYIIIVVTLLYTAIFLSLIPTSVKRSTERIVQREEVEQGLRAIFDEEDTYETEPISYQEIYISELVKELFRDAISIGMIAGIMLIVRKIKKKALMKTNMENQQKNQQIQWENQRIAEERQKTKDKMNEVRNSRKLVETEISTNVKGWFPEGYDSIEAIDYFIMLLDTQKALNMQQAVRLYELEVHRK